MRVRRPGFALIALLLVAGLSAGVVALRLPLAEIVLARVLTSRGIEGGARVTRLDLDGASLADLRLAGYRAARIDIGYGVAGLLEGRLDSLRVVGLRASLEARRADSLLTGPSPGDADMPQGPGSEPLLPLGLSRVLVDDARLRLQTPQGPAALGLDGSATAEPGGRTRIALRLAAEHRGVTLSGPLEVELAGRQPSRIEATLSARGPEDAGAEITLRAAPLEDGPELSLAARLQASGAALATAAPDLVVAEGRGRAALRLTGRLPDRDALPLTLEAWARWLAAGQLSGTLELGADSLVLRDRAAGLSLDLAARFEQDDEGRRLFLTRSASLNAAALDPDWLVALGVPAAAARRLRAGVAASLGGAQARPALSVPRETAQGPLELALGAALRLADDSTADLALSARHSPGTGAPADWLGRLAQGRGDANLRLTFAGWRFPGRAAGLDGEISGRLTQRQETVALSLDSPIQVSASSLETAWLEALGLPPALAAPLAAGARLTVSGQDEAPLATWQGRDSGAEVTLRGRAEASTASGQRLQAALDSDVILSRSFAPQSFDIKSFSLNASAWTLERARLAELRLSGRLSGTPAAFSGPLDLALALRDLAALRSRAGAATLQAAVDLAVTADAWRAELREPARLAVKGVRDPRLARPFDLEGALSGGALAITPSPDGLAAEAALDLTVASVQLAVERVDAAPLPLTLEPGPLQLRALVRPDGAVTGSLRLSQARLAAAGQPLSLTGLDLVVERGEDGRLRIDLRGGRLLPAAEVPLPPLDLSGGLVQTGAAPRYRLDLHASGPAGTPRLEAAGQLDAAAGTGSAEITLEPLRFAPGGLQPAALSPALAALQAVRGEAAADARIAWSEAGFDGTGQVRLSDLGFTYGGAAVAGLDLALELDRLIPPRSPPEQRLTVAAVTAGPTLTDIDLRFQLAERAETGPVIALSGGEATALGGRLTLREGTIALAGRPRRLVVEAEGLDMAALAGLLALDDLAISGRLSGRIPVSLEGGRPVVEGAKLAATGDGVLSFRSPEARQALASGGEAVDLMLRALEDFRYDEFGLGLDMPGAGEARATLRLKGANPAVLDGYPFAININLTADPAPLFAALAEGTAVQQDVLRRLWKLER